MRPTDKNRSQQNEQLEHSEEAAKGAVGLNGGARRPSIFEDILWKSQEAIPCGLVCYRPVDGGAELRPVPCVGEHKEKLDG